MTSIATVTSKGQVTLPAAVRRALGIATGDRISFAVEGDHAVVRPAPDFLALAGTVHVPDEVRDLSWEDIKAKAYRDSARA